MTNLCLFVPEKDLDILRKLLPNYQLRKGDMVEQKYIPSGLGLSNDPLIVQFDTYEEILIRNYNVFIIKDAILSFISLVIDNPKYFKIEKIKDNKIQIGNNIFIKLS